MSECVGCTLCGDFAIGKLYARMAKGVWMCAACWVEVGRPRAAADAPEDPAAAVPVIDDRQLSLF